MSPQKIVQKSLRKNLDIIAICDHNSAQNTEAVVRSGEKHGICVIPGMEICSREEVHLLGLFGSLENTLALQEYVYAHLKGENRPAVFGHQVIVNEHDEVLGEDSHVLEDHRTNGSLPAPIGQLLLRLSRRPDCRRWHRSGKNPAPAPPRTRTPRAAPAPERRER